MSDHKLLPKDQWANEFRAWADHPAESGMVPVHPNTLRKVADILDPLGPPPNSVTKEQCACHEYSHYLVRHTAGCYERQLESLQRDIQAYRGALGYSVRLPAVPANVLTERRKAIYPIRRKIPTRV